MTARDLACLDGRTAAVADTFIPVTDDGFIRGDGVFEVIRVYDGQPFALSEHLDRIERSAANLRLDREVPRAELEREVPALVEERGGREFDGVVRIVLTRGGRRLVMTEPLPPSTETARLAYVTYAPTRILDGIKSLSYAGNMLASRIARDRGFDEALLVTPHGRVLEGPTSSFFAVLGGRLVTPPLSEHVLDSITRRLVVDVAAVVGEPFSLDDLRGARAAFLASTTREVQPVARVEDIELDVQDALVRDAAARVGERIAAEVAG